MLLALTNLSQEKFLRIISAKRFIEKDFGNEWGRIRIFRKMRQDDEFAVSIARMFIEGRSNQLLSEQVADFYLDQLQLPDKWSDVIHDKTMIGNIVRKKLFGEYHDLKGLYVEKMIKSYLDSLEKEFNICYEQGQVSFLGKEVDIAIPSLENPIVMVMVSYMETTSSGQTTRANEQQALYEKIIGKNVRYAPIERVFVNVVDGAGWLARRSDLRKMHAGCHYCLNLNTLNDLEKIVLRYVRR